jgi:hypothetical protein
MTDTAQDLSKLSLAFDRANTSITRTGAAFGELARSSQEWNIVSRILSGTGMWRVQNQIRAVGNIINVMHKRQEEATKSTIEAIEANLKLAESLKDIVEAKKKLSEGGQALKNDPIFQFFEEISGGNGKSEYKKYWGMAEKQLNKAKSGIVKSFMPNTTRDYLKGGFRAGEDSMGTMEFLKRKREDFMDTGLGRHFIKGGGGLRDFGLDKRESGKGIRRHSGDPSIGQRMRKSFARIGEKLAPIAGKISQFFIVGAFALGKFMLYFIAIVTGFALLIFIIKKMKLGTRFKKFEEQFGLFGKILGNVKEALTGVFMMFQGAFGGDGKKLQDGFFKMMNGLIGILLRVLQTMLSLLLKGIFTAIGGIVKGIGRAINSTLGFGGNTIIGYGNNIQSAGAYLGGGLASFANGGVSSGGMALVGERGPELVRLPSGARVHSNAESRRMSGGTINVHVNGRVGASDAEIRDIANKVAREINLKMNRTAHTTGRL